MNRFAALLPAALLLTGCATTDMWSEAPGTYRYAQSAPVPWWGHDAPSIDMFYRPLSAYGRWIDYPAYGMVFIPNGIGPNWRPFSRGYWSNDRYGRRWMSQEPFGWATYHYGRWGHDPRLGWFWVPDIHFSPAWVDWQQGDGYASWAPMPPIGWSNYGYYGSDWWISAPDMYLWRPGLYQYIRPGYPGYYRPNRPHRPDHPNRPDRPDRPDRPHRPDRPDRPGHPGWNNDPDRPVNRPVVIPRPGGQKDPPPSNIGRPPQEDRVYGNVSEDRGGSRWQSGRAVSRQNGQAAHRGNWGAPGGRRPPSQAVSQGAPAAASHRMPPRAAPVVAAAPRMTPPASAAPRMASPAPAAPRMAPVAASRPAPPPRPSREPVPRTQDN